MNKITVGLDLGTDKCCLTYQDNIGRPFIITDNNNYKISSIIGIINNGVLVGNEISKDFIYDIPIITNLKRLIGHNSTSTEALNIASYNGWSLSDSTDNDLVIHINQIEYKLNDLMCILLKKIKQIIITNIGEDFNLIITIPANFNEGQKNIILSYCKQLNIVCKRLIYEPCSAALTYINYFDPDYNKLSKDCSDEDILKRIIVIDFGAGTLDLAIVSCNCIVEDDAIEWMAKIESNIGDNNLGGLDIDIALGRYIDNKYPEFKKLLDLKNESMKFIVEKIKIKLSKLYNEHKNHNISLVEKYYKNVIIISIEEYFQILNDQFKNKIINLLDNIHNSNIKKSDIDTILLIGGSCYNPWIKNLVSEYYNKEISDYKLNITDHINSYNLDIKDIGVSLGATCIDKKTDKNSSPLVITESLPLSIGIHTTNNIMCKILQKNSLIPCMAKNYFTTSENNQNQIEIKLYQGEKNDIRDNFFLGSFIMDNLPPEPQGKIVIIVIVSVSTDGLITVQGKVKNIDKFDKKIIINRYNMLVDTKQVELNIKQYELTDSIFNSIMLKYYELITMLNKLQYNLLDNISCLPDKQFIDNIMSLFWDDLLIVYNLILQSDKIKPNISQLDKFIKYINTKLDYEIKLPRIDYTDDIIIASKLDTLNKFMNKNLQHIVLTYQIRVEGINESNNEDKYDSLESGVNLGQLNSISNSTEILNSTEKELLYAIERTTSNIDQTKSNLTYLKEIKDFTSMFVNDIDEFYMNDERKLLLLDIIEKYETYIEITSSVHTSNTDERLLDHSSVRAEKLIGNNSEDFDGKYHLEQIQNICLIISDTDDEELIERLQKNISDMDMNSSSFNIEFESILNMFQPIRLNDPLLLTL